MCALESLVSQPWIAELCPVCGGSPCQSLCFCLPQGMVPFIFVGTRENISNAQALLEYHLSYLQVRPEPRSTWLLLQRGPRGSWSGWIQGEGQQLRPPLGRRVWGLLGDVASGAASSTPLPSFLPAGQEVEQLRLERLQIDEQLRQIGLGFRPLSSSRSDKERGGYTTDESTSSLHGTRTYGGSYGGRGRGRRGPNSGYGAEGKGAFAEGRGLPRRDPQSRWLLLEGKATLSQPSPPPPP